MIQPLQGWSNVKLNTSFLSSILPNSPAYFFPGFHPGSLLFNPFGVGRIPQLPTNLLPHCLTTLLPYLYLYFLSDLRTSRFSDSWLTTHDSRLLTSQPPCPELHSGIRWFNPFRVGRILEYLLISFLTSPLPNFPTCICIFFRTFGLPDFRTLHSWLPDLHLHLYFLSD